MSKAPKKYQIFTHLFAIISVALSCALITYTVVGPWIIVINQTSTSNVDIGGTAKGHSLRAWGFGAWGFCEISYDPLVMQSPAVCTRGFWSLPGSVSPQPGDVKLDLPRPDHLVVGDDVLKLDLPEAITKVLSGLCVLLIFAAIVTAGWTLMLVAAFIQPRPSNFTSVIDVWTATPFKDLAPEERRRATHSDRMRGWLGWSLFGATWTFVLPIMITLGVARSQMAHGLQASMGLGAQLLIGALVTSFIGEILQWWWNKGGLRLEDPNKHKERYHAAYTSR